MLVDVAAKHGRHHKLIKHPAAASCAVLFASFLIGYVLLEKKCLPRKWWRPLSKFYFGPLMLPNLLLRVASGRPYFSDVDGGVMLGAVPMVIAGHIEALCACAPVPNSALPYMHTCHHRTASLF